MFSVLDQCLMTIFVCEILVKWYHGFFMFWKRGWNVLDFFIVVALLLGPCEFIVDMKFLIFTCNLLFFRLLVFLLVQIKYA